MNPAKTDEPTKLQFADRLVWAQRTLYEIWYTQALPGKYKQSVHGGDGASCEITLTTHTQTHLFNGPLSGTTQVSRYQKGKNNLDFHQLGHMPVCTSLQTDIHASTPPLSFLQAGCPSCRPTNSIKALKATGNYSDHL